MPDLRAGRLEEGLGSFIFTGVVAEVGLGGLLWLLGLTGLELLLDLTGLLAVSGVPGVPAGVMPCSWLKLDLGMCCVGSALRRRGDVGSSARARWTA